MKSVTRKGGAPFVCVEPWYGHADYADFDGNFKDKEGVIALEKVNPSKQVTP